MGAEESKLGTSGGGGASGGPCYGLMQPSTVVSTMNRQAQLARAWALLHQCSLDQWKAGHGEAAGFSENIMTCNNMVFKDCSPAFCTSRQGIINIHKSSSIFSFRRRRKFTKMAEHFEYKVIPAQMSCVQNFHVKSVLCYQDNTVILHLIRNMTTQFGIVDLSQNKFLGIFGEQFSTLMNEVLRGAVTPDCTLCLIKMPQVQSGRNNVVFNFQLYDLKTRSLLSVYQLPYNESLFAFDPRFNSTRLVATWFVPGGDNSLSLVRLKDWEPLATNPRLDDMRYVGQNPQLKDILYSKDGCLIFALMVAGGCHCRERNLRKSRRTQPIDVSIYIFDGDTAQTLHCIQYHRYTCGLHMCPINYTPLFSTCGSRMAIILNDMESAIDHVQIYKLPNTMSLQNRCRIRILQHFPQEVISRLPLPTRLIQYLKFSPEYD